MGLQHRMLWAGQERATHLRQPPGWAGPREEKACLEAPHQPEVPPGQVWDRRTEIRRLGALALPETPPCPPPASALGARPPRGYNPSSSPLPALRWFCCTVAPRLNPGLLSHQSRPQPGPPVLGPALCQQVLSEQQSAGTSADAAPPSCSVQKPMSHPPDLLQACPREHTPSRAAANPRGTLGRPLTPGSVASGAFPQPPSPPRPRPDGNIFFLPAGCCASCRKRASGGKVLFIAPHWGQAMARAAGEASGLVRVRPRGGKLNARTRAGLRCGGSDTDWFPSFSASVGGPTAFPGPQT